MLLRFPQMRDYCRRSLIPCARLGLVLWFCLAGVVAIAFEKPKHKVLPDLDNGRPVVPSPTPRQQDALKRLQTRHPRAKFDLHPFRGSPQWIRPGEGSALAPGAPGKAFDPAVSIRAFVAQYQDLFGHPAAVLDAITIRRQATNSHNQIRTLAWEQSLDEIPVYGSVFVGHVSSDGDLLALSSTFVPEVERAAENGAAESGGRFALEAAVIDGKAGIRVEQAIVMAAESIEQPIDPASMTSNAPPLGPSRQQEFSVQDVPGSVECKLRWWPKDQTTLRLCWQVDLTRRIGGERYRVLVDVQSGEVQVRRCLTLNAAPVTFRVFTGDSPSPMSPGSPVPGTNQPTLVPRDLITLTSLFTNASPIGWINETENQTRGNNVDAHLDRNDDDLPDLPRPQGSPFRVFDFTLDLTHAPSTYSDASVVQDRKSV